MRRSANQKPPKPAAKHAGGRLVSYVRYGRAFSLMAPAPQEAAGYKTALAMAKEKLFHMMGIGKKENILVGTEAAVADISVARPHVATNALQAEEGTAIKYTATKIYNQHLKCLCEEGKQASAQRIAELVYDNVAPEEEKFGVLRLAMSVLSSVVFFCRTWLSSPVVRNDANADVYKATVLIAAVPAESARQDRAFEDATGFNRKLFSSMRKRRDQPRLAMLSFGLVRTIRKSQRRHEDYLQAKVKAQKFWVAHTAPANLGDGKRDRRVSACTQCCHMSQHLMIMSHALPLQNLCRSGQGKHFESHVKVFAEESFYNLYLRYRDHLDRKEKRLSFTQFRDSKPYFVRTERKVVSCICVHHRSFLLRVQALAKVRSGLHNSKQLKRRGHCYHSPTCECDCHVCRNGEQMDGLHSFLNVVMCPRPQGKTHYALQCVLGKCEMCGFDRKVLGCPVEDQYSKAVVTARVLDKVTFMTAKGRKRFAQEVNKEQEYFNFIKATRAECSSFLKHDWLARWQGQLYRDMFTWLEPDMEMWISDYIEVRCDACLPSC